MKRDLARAFGPPSARRSRHIMIGTSLLAGVIFVLGQTLNVAPEFFDGIFLPVVFGSLLALATLSCAREAMRDRHDRLAWLVFAIGLGLWSLGAVCRTAFFDGTDTRPMPAWIDPLFLAFYPLVFISLLLVIKGRLRRFAHIPWFYGGSVALAVIALSLAFFYEPVQRQTGNNSLETIILLAYPIGDLLLAAAVAYVIWINQMQRTGPWPLIAAGLLLFAAADVGFAYLMSSGEHVGPFFWLMWIVGTMLIVAGSWQVDGDVREVTPGNGQLLLPLGVSLSVIIVLLVGQGRDLVDGAIWFGLAALALVLSGLVVSARENMRLFHSGEHLMKDQLTGLPSRSVIDSWLTEIAPEPGRFTSSTGLLLVKIARYHELKTALGHRASDVIVSAMGTRLNRSVSHFGRLGRLGSDEFVLIADGNGTQSGMEGIADQVLASLKTPFKVDGLSLQLQASIGAAIAPEHATDGTDLLRLASQAGRKAEDLDIPFHIYSGRPDYAINLELLDELREALERDQFTLHYQPKVTLGREAIESVEALLRWEHPERGLLGPFAFLEAAEHHGLMHAITGMVLKKSIDQSAAWKREGLDLGVAVNLAMPNLVDTELPRQVMRKLSEAGVEPSTLTLELTENIVMSDPERMLGNILRLRDTGVQISLDDFGAGATSLTYLRELPIDEVKMDRSITGDLQGSEAGWDIAVAMIGISRRLGLRVVAEGVEDRATVDRLRELDCTEIQGYVFARPMPAAEVAGFVKSFKPDTTAET